MIFRCPCGQTKEYDKGNNCYNVRDAEKDTEWKWVPKRDGGAVWLCPCCTIKAIELAKQLVQVMGTNDVFVPTLVKEERING